MHLARFDHPMPGQGGALSIGLRPAIVHPESLLRARLARLPANHGNTPQPLAKAPMHVPVNNDWWACERDTGQPAGGSGAIACASGHVNRGDHCL